MSAPNLKELKKLASLCRKQGITSFKYHNDGSYEFSLDPTHDFGKPEKRNNSSKSQDNSIFRAVEGEPLLTDEQLLFWSSGGALNPKEAEEQ